MKLTMNEWLRAGRWLAVCLMGMAFGSMAYAQAVSTTTVQGTVYLANGQPGAGTLDVSWPAFTTANNQAVAAGHAAVTIAPDGFLSVNLAPNLGATPAGLYYTAVYHMIDGTTNTEYWVVPATAQAALGQVRAQVMPAAQAVQAVSKTYVDQAVSALSGSVLSSTGGTLSGPLILSGDPTQPLQAADKHYVDETFAEAVPLSGGSMTGPLATPALNGVQAPLAGSTQTTLQAAMSAAGTNGAMEIPPTYAGTDTFANPNGVYVRDLRQTNSQQFERSVKEFGAVCDGTTDDTNALQAAINYAQTHGVSLTIPQGKCKTHTLVWHGEPIGGLGKQVSALVGFPGQDVLATVTDSTNMLSYTRIHDLTIYVDQSVDVSCSAAEGRAPAGSCAVSRPLESNSIFSPGGNGQTGTVGTGAGWAVGNCAIAMPASTGAGGNGLRVAEIENLEIATTGVDPMAQYSGAHSTHTCGLYLGQWPQWSEFRNIDIRGLNTGVAIPALPGTTPAGLNADSNRWQNITIQATHGFTAAAGSNNVLDNVVDMAGNSSATAEPPTGLVLDFAGSQQGWTVRNSVVLPTWSAVQPQLTVAAAGGAVTGVTVGPEHGLGFDPYGTQVTLAFSGSCTAQATASVNTNGSIGAVTVTQGGVGCSGTTTASVNAAGTWDTAAPVNLISGQNMSFFAGNLLKGNGGYTVWKAAGSQSYGTQLDGGGGTLPGGGSYAALVTTNPVGSAFQADQFPGVDFGAKLQQCLGAVSATYGGTCDARNFTGSQSMGSNLTISTANTTVLLPCATISTANHVVVTGGTRNVALRGCALRGASTASGSQGGTVFLYSGTGAMVQVGDPTYTTDTLGFHLDNVAINTTASTSATATGLVAYRTQEMDVESLYSLGNSNQTGMTLDGTGNYTGGTFFDDAFSGFQTAVNAIGHQVSNTATTDWMNASTFVRLHVDCPTSGGSPIAGTYGINLQQGDGNTFTGGDVEGCNTALHLGANAQNNTIVGLRNENSNNQVVADAGSSYNNWMTGGTMFTGQLTDNGTRNSFLDTFHRSFNGVNGDWYGSQKDATVTNHYRIGIGAGNERGLLDRYQTDYGYRWTTGLSDATAGEQFYQILDELNSVYRLSIGQYNNGQSSTNNQTVINAAGTGAVVLNGSNNSGTGGVVIGSGGPSETTVATISNAGSAQFNGTLQVGGPSTFNGSTTIRNQENAEIDSTLWAGMSATQKESFIYKDYNGNSQWYLEKDASNNWELNSAIGGLDSFKAYQSSNSGDTYINASNSSGVVRVNYESGSGSAFNIYGGNSSTLYASFTGTSAIKFPGLAAGTGHNCLQVDTSGYITNTGIDCGSGSGSGSTISSGTTGQIAYYSANGTTIGGESTVPVSAGGTGAGNASNGLANLNGISSTQTTQQSLAGPLSLSNDTPTGHQAASANAAVTTFSVLAYGAKADLVPAHGAAPVTATVTNGSNVLSFVGYLPVSTDVGKYVAFLNEYNSGGPPFPTSPQTAQIIALGPTNNQVTLSQTAINNTTAYVSWGTDNVPAFNACRAAAAAAGGGICTVPAGNYLLATSPYMVVTGATDDGSYGTQAGGSGAVVSATVSGGTISNYTVSNGGSGYTPNSTLQVNFSGGCGTAGYENGPCGWAFATANTNSAGQVTSVNSIYPGYGFSSAPTVTIVPLGGDGAAATATVSSGTMNTPTLTAGGGGYAANSTLDWYALGGGCSTISTLGGVPVAGKGTVGTNASGAASGAMTVTSNATGCSTAPAIIFSDYACNTGTAASPVWGQCSNMAPVNPIQLPVQVMIQPTVSFEGESGSLAGAANLFSVWDGFAVDNNEPAVFGGTFGYSDLRNLSINNAFIGILSTNNVNYGKFENLTFGGGIGMLTAATDLDAVFNDLSFQGYASWINGGNWAHRVDYPQGAGGFFDANYVGNITSRLMAYGPVASSLDAWFDNNFWKSPYSANSTDFPGSCSYPLGANQRQTSHAMNSGQTANTMCYPGISSIGLGIFVRDGRGTGAATLDHLQAKQISRPIFYGDFGAMAATDMSCEGCVALGSGADPYRAAPAQLGAVVINENISSSGGRAAINGVSWYGSTVSWCLYSLLAQGSPMGASWTNVNCSGATNSQPMINPQFNNNINFPSGLSMTLNTNTETPGQIAFYSQYLSTPEGYVSGENKGIQFDIWNPSLTTPAFADAMDMLWNGVFVNEPLSAFSLTVGSGTQMTGSAGNGGLAQETTSAAKTSGNPVAWDSNGNTVNAPVQGNGAKVQLSTGTTSANDCVKFDANGNTVDAGAACGFASGSVSNIATSGPITGGPITTTGTIGCATCVVSSSPGAGIAHFAGSSQSVTSSLINLTTDVSGIAGTQGNGTKIQLSTGTTTSGDCVKFDANGNTIDSGAACVTASSISWPSGGAGIPNYTGSSAWGTSYSASSQIPNTFIPFASPGNIGTVSPGIGDFTTINLNGATGSGVLNLGSGTTSASGVYFGSDTQLYRKTAGSLPYLSSNEPISSSFVTTGSSAIPAFFGGNASNVYPVFGLYAPLYYYQAGMGLTNDSVFLANYSNTDTYQTIANYMGALPNSSSAPTNAAQIFANGGMVQRSGATLGWNSSPAGAGTANAALSQDTGLSRSAAGIVSVDTSTAGNGLGSILAAAVNTSSSSTFGGSANLFNNNAAATNVLALQAGSGAAQTTALEWNNYAGTAEWQWNLDTGYTLHLADKVNSINRIDAYQNGNTNISAGNGANSVCINCAANSGTSGLLVQNGAASPSTVLTVTGSGNTTAAGFISGKFFMGTGTMSLAAGAAAGTGPAIVCATNHVCSGWNGTVTLTTGTSPATGTLATLSFPNTHTNYADCEVSMQSPTGLVTTNTWSESTTALTITANTALAASTAYTVKYICGGN
jgi:hypothetical protein